MVSIILPNYNKSKYISETISSVINQTSSEWELIVVDDCSTDSSLQAIENFLNKNSQIKLIKNSTNQGANFCRNKGLSEAKGEWVIFLDGDDILSPHCIMNRLNFISNFPEIDFAVFPMKPFKEKLTDANPVWIPEKNRALQRFLSHQLPWTITQPFWKKKSLIRINGFDESFKRMQDVELHTRALMAGFKFEVNKGKPDCFYRIVENRISDKETYIKNFAESVSKYYVKFFEYCHANNLYTHLFHCLIESLIYLENYSKNNNSFSIQSKQQMRNFFFSLNLSRYHTYLLKLISIIYSNKLFYPRGLKFFLKHILS